jgi:hypothetical protein
LADGRPREDAAEWPLRLRKASPNLQGQLSATLLPIGSAMGISARDPLRLYKLNDLPPGSHHRRRLRNP